ncbi:hypothetical protein ME763_35295 [Streptomyces murinus]|uniref:hypothetical protein n=1 Tax=Streptomyces murinus TaxID=33900 RepID=UPI002378EFE7|nr:hypothetical protein [Streptomyces murinus]WDO10498.1 hypothetical protein ME763_35295 [Streptomyces murinus]
MPGCWCHWPPGFEIANVVSRLAAPDGDAARAPEPYRLGALETAWRSLERHTGTPTELRAALVASPWGDPGGDTPWALVTGMRMAAARRTDTAVPDARRWARARAVLLLARERFVHGRALPEPVRRDAARLLGPRAPDAASYEEFRDCLPSSARWVLAEVGEPGGLWRAEARWWRTVGGGGRSAAAAGGVPGPGWSSARWPCCPWMPGGGAGGAGVGGARRPGAGGVRCPGLRR